MAIKETQITIRISTETLDTFRALRSRITEESIVAPNMADLHRAIYEAGLGAMFAKLDARTMAQTISSIRPPDDPPMEYEDDDLGPPPESPNE